MFVFLYKKITVPNNVKIKSVGWSHEHGYIALGGDDGGIRIIKVDPIASSKSQSSSKSLNISQQLEGHQGMITMSIWNEVYQKLTTCDDKGLIIVWVMRDDQWVEEMANHREDKKQKTPVKIPVTGIDWSPDGQLICITYEDGLIIVGTYEGNKLWNIELNSTTSRVKWSPDSKLLLVGIKANEPIVRIFDDRGNAVSKLNLSELNDSSELVGLDWNSYYSNIGHESLTESPTLAVAIASGKVQLMRNESDPSPTIINTDVIISCISWNHTASVLAVCGRDRDSKSLLVKFYSPYGDLLQTLRLPGRNLTDVSWEKEGLRIAIAIDTYLFIASVKPQYEWAFFGDTLAYTLSKGVSDGSLSESIDPGHSDPNTSTIIFCNLKSGTRKLKHMKNLLCIAGCGHHCVIAVKGESDQLVKSLDPRLLGSNLILCNSLGTSTENRVIEVTANCICMTTSLVIVGSKDTLITWTYDSLNSSQSMRPTFDDELENTRRASNSSSFSLAGRDNLRDNLITISLPEYIKCMSCTEKSLAVGLRGGKVIIYTLPKLSQIQSINLAKCLPVSVGLNCDSSKIVILDSTSTATMYDLEGPGTLAKQVESFEKKDVWSFMWSADEPSAFALTEKNKLLLFNEMEVEETVHASGYVCSFSEYEIKSIDLDTLINEQPNNDQRISNYVNVLETRILKEIRSLLTKEGLKVGFKKATQVAEAHNSDRLWKLIADQSLKALAFDEAELAFIRCKDYKGIQFLKKLTKLQSDLLKKAEVCAYFGELDLAESTFLEADRRDLAIKMRKKMWQPLNVIQLINQDLGSIPDAVLQSALLDAGDYYADHMDWMSAATFYQQSGNLEKLIESLIATEQFDKLSHFMKSRQFTNESYEKIAYAFLSVGMCEEAVEAFIKVDKVTEAIEACVTLNEWQIALKLAQENQISEIDDLLAQYASHLLAKKKYFDIIELYKKADRIHDSANMILKLIEDAKRKHGTIGSPVLMKQLYTLIGILYSNENKSKDKRGARADASFARRNTLTSLLREDESLITAAATFRAVDRPWRGAEAFHFYLLAHKHLYSGNVDNAMKAALYLRDFEDLLGSEPVFALIALTACANRSFALCSKALLRLETLDSLDDTQRIAYENLAISIFTQFPPKESKNIPKSECAYCETLIADYLSVCPSCNTRFQVCTATGKPIMDANLSWTCIRCQHSAFKSEVTSLEDCPLCHQRIN